jgi:hypothetical protein
VDLRKQKVDGPQYLNIDFIQNKIDRLNSMVDYETSKSGPQRAVFDDFESPPISDFEVLKTEFTNNPPKTDPLDRAFKIKLMTLNNYYYDSEVLLVFDGYNVYKYIEDKKNE